MSTVILVIDDLASHRQMIRFAIQLPGRNILEAETIARAVLLTDGRKIDLLIAGCNDDGSVCSEKIRHFCALRRMETLPVIITSHKYVSPDTLADLPVGPFSWLKKPFRISEIQSVVNHSLSD